MIAIFCGDRDWDDYEKIKQVMECIHYGWWMRERCLTLVVQGGARGADSLSKKAAKNLSIRCKTVVANWRDHHRAAGPIRNKKMLDTYKPKLVVAFHSNIEKSKGTKDMLRQAKKAGITTILVS